MNTVANQKVITTTKEKCDKDNPYTAINLATLQDAMIDLTDKTFKLWMYISKNQNGYTFALSAVDAIKWGMGSRSSYNRAVKELIEKGYLVDKGGNHFDFFERPRLTKVTVTVNKETEGFSF